MALRDNNQSLINSQEPKALYQRVRLPLGDGLKRGQSPVGHFKKPFRGLWVYDVSSSTVDVSVRFNSRHDTGAKIPLKKNMVINHPHQVMDAEFLAEEQEGQWIELVFSIDSEINIGNIEQQVTGDLGLVPDTLNKLTGGRLKHGAFDLPDTSETVLLKSSFPLGGNFRTIDAGSFGYTSMTCTNNSDYNVPNATASSQKSFKVPAGYEFLPISLGMIILQEQTLGALNYNTPLFVGSLKDSSDAVDIVPVPGSVATEIESKFSNAFASFDEFNPIIQAPQLSDFNFDGTFETWAGHSSYIVSNNGPAILNENERVAIGIFADGSSPGIDAMMNFTILGKLRKLPS